MEESKWINCGDWHLGWGYSGHDKVGKLRMLRDGVFEWKGSSHGRHGQRWNAGAHAIFDYHPDNDSDWKKVEVSYQKGKIPVASELVKGCEELLTIKTKQS